MWPTGPTVLHHRRSSTMPMPSASPASKSSNEPTPPSKDKLRRLPSSQAQKRVELSLDIARDQMAPPPEVAVLRWSGPRLPGLPEIRSVGDRIGSMCWLKTSGTSFLRYWGFFTFGVSQFFWPKNDKTLGRAARANLVINPRWLGRPSGQCGDATGTMNLQLTRLQRVGQTLLTTNGRIYHGWSNMGYIMIYHDIKMAIEMGIMIIWTLIFTDEMGLAEFQTKPVQTCQSQEILPPQKGVPTTRHPHGQS